MSNREEMLQMAQQQIDIIRQIGEESGFLDTSGIANQMQEYLDDIIREADTGNLHVVALDHHGVWTASFNKELVYADKDGDEWEFSPEKNAWCCRDDHDEREPLSQTRRSYPNCPHPMYAPYTEVRDA